MDNQLLDEFHSRVIDIADAICAYADGEALDARYVQAAGLLVAVLMCRRRDLPSAMHAFIRKVVEVPNG